MWMMSKIYECKRYSKISCVVCRPIVAETGKVFFFFFYVWSYYIYWLHTKYVMPGAKSITACFWYPRLSFTCTFLSENQSRRNQSYIALNFFNQFQCLFSTTIQVLFWVTKNNSKLFVLVRRCISGWQDYWSNCYNFSTNKFKDVVSLYGFRKFFFF